MKQTLLILLSLFFVQFAAAQSNIIDFDYEKSSFNENFPLPAEKTFAITGQISTKVMMVEIEIYKEKKPNKKPLYTNLWKRAFDPNITKFYVPISYKLHGNEEYDLVVNYYRQATTTEIQNLRNDLFKALNAYIEQSLSVSKKRLALSKNASQLTADLNSLVEDALVYYRNPANLKFEGLSDLVKNKIRQVESNKVGISGIFQNKSKKEGMVLTRQKYLQELQALIQDEVSFLLNAGLSVIGDSKTIEKVESEKTKNYLTVHVGYGGAYLDEKNEPFGTGFHAGITLPLGSRTFASNFWRRTSLVAGVFFNDFKVNDVKISGPFVGRPAYLGLGYKLFQFVRLTAGVTSLERPETNNPNEKEIYFKPFVGIVADIDVWFNLRR